MWRIAGASVIGTSHVGLGLPCQDAHRCVLLHDRSGGEVLVAAAADGAGSARFADRGASLAVETFMSGIAQFLTGHTVGDLSTGRLQDIVARTRQALVDEAARLSTPAHDLACTFLGAVAGPHAAAFCQIGDGALIVSEAGDGDDWSWVFWPQRGEYANATSFLTDEDALRVVETAALGRSVEELAILTDGLEPMVLAYASRSVFAPFFQAMFAPLRDAPDPGVSEALCQALGVYLNSPQINQRTDDDKTLILATRRRSAPAAD